MGHRANFVLIEDGKARAFEDQWAALGCTLSLEEGAKKLKRELPKVYAATEELMDWGFAEAGILVDYDERVCIAFGHPEVNLEELPEEYAAEIREVMEAFEAGWPTFVSFIAKGWAGFTLVWDERGVDAFAAHLKRRAITSIKTQAASHPKSTAKTKPIAVVVTADDASRPKKREKKAPEKAATKPKEAAPKETASAKKAPTRAATKPKAAAKKPPSRATKPKKAAPAKTVRSGKKTATKKAAKKNPATKKAAKKNPATKKAAKKNPATKKAR